MILAPSNAIPNIQRVNSPITPNQTHGQSKQQLQPTQIQTTQIQPTQIQWAGQNIQVLSGSGSSTGFQVVDLRNTQDWFQISSIFVIGLSIWKLSKGPSPAKHPRLQSNSTIHPIKQPVKESVVIPFNNGVGKFLECDSYCMTQSLFRTDWTSPKRQNS